MEQQSIYTRQNSSSHSLRSLYKTRNHSSKRSPVNNTAEQPIYIVNPLHSSSGGKQNGQPQSQPLPLPHPASFTNHVHISSPLPFRRINSSNANSIGGRQSSHDKRWYSSGSDQSSVGSVVGRPAMGGGGIGLSGQLYLQEQPSTQSSCTLDTQSTSQGSAEVMLEQQLLPPTHQNSEDYAALYEMCKAQANDLEALTTLLCERELAREATHAMDRRWATVDDFLRELGALLVEANATTCNRIGALHTGLAEASSPGHSRDEERSLPLSHERRMATMDAVRVAAQTQRLRFDAMQKELARTQSELHRTQTELTLWKRSGGTGQAVRLLPAVTSKTLPPSRELAVSVTLQTLDSKKDSHDAPTCSIANSDDSRRNASGENACNDFFLVSGLGEQAEVRMRAELATVLQQRDAAELEKRRLSTALELCRSRLQQREEQMQAQHVQLRELRHVQHPLSTSWPRGASATRISSCSSSFANMSLSPRSNSLDSDNKSDEDATYAAADGRAIDSGAKDTMHSDAAATTAVAVMSSSRRTRRAPSSSQTHTTKSAGTGSTACIATTTHRRIIAGSDYVALLSHARDTLEKALQHDLCTALHLPRSAVQVTDIQAASRCAICVHVALQHRSKAAVAAAETAVLSASLPTLGACASCVTRGAAWNSSARAAVEASGDTRTHAEAPDSARTGTAAAEHRSNAFTTYTAATARTVRQMAEQLCETRAECAALLSRVHELEERCISREADVQTTLESAVETITSLYAALQHCEEDGSQAECDAQTERSKENVMQVDMHAEHEDRERSSAHSTQNQHQQQQESTNRTQTALTLPTVTKDANHCGHADAASATVVAAAPSAKGGHEEHSAQSLTEMLHAVTLEKCALQRQVSEMETDMTEMGRLRAKLQRDLEMAQGKLRALQHERQSLQPQTFSSTSHKHHHHHPRYHYDPYRVSGNEEDAKEMGSVIVPGTEQNEKRMVRSQTISGMGLHPYEPCASAKRPSRTSSATRDASPNVSRARRSRSRGENSVQDAHDTSPSQAGRCEGRSHSAGHGGGSSSSRRHRKRSLDGMSDSQHASSGANKTDSHTVEQNKDNQCHSYADDEGAWKQSASAQLAQPSASGRPLHARTSATTQTIFDHTARTTPTRCVAPSTPQAPATPHVRVELERQTSGAKQECGDFGAVELSSKPVTCPARRGLFSDASATTASGMSPLERTDRSKQLTSSPVHVSTAPSLCVLRRSYTTTPMSSQVLTRTPSAKRRLLFNA